MDEYVLKVLNMMHKASAKNALNIVSKIVGTKNNPAEYPFEEFLNRMCVMLPQSNLPPSTQLKIHTLCVSKVQKLHNGFKYNMQMLADDFILSLWSIIWNREP